MRKHPCALARRLVEHALRPDYLLGRKPGRRCGACGDDDSRGAARPECRGQHRLVVTSENTRIQDEAFVRDVHVEAPGFHLVGATLD